MWIVIAATLLGIFVTTWILGRELGAPYADRWPSRREQGRWLVVPPGEAHLALAARWDSTDPALAPTPDAESIVADLERRYDISIPEDFRTYLLTTAPSAYYCDDDGTAWWTLAEIKNIPDECGDNGPRPWQNPAISAEEGKYLVFADYLVWCYAWAICCSEGENRGRIALVAEQDDFVADSFTRFVELELNFDSAIHPRPFGPAA